jgi:hypothetical protein
MKALINNVVVKFYRHLIILGGLGLLAIATPVFATSTNPVGWADDLVLHITPDHNDYASNPNYIYWAGVNGAVNYENRTQCNSFLTNVLKQSYGWTSNTFKAWFGSTSPTAAMYHDAIQSQNGFTSLSRVQDLAIGDVIAIKYPDGSANTGHVMLMRSAPQEITAIAPIIVGTRQYAVEVFDSSNSGHGANDTRRMPDGSWDSGAGIGVFRIYADENSGEVAGHTWSTYSNSIYYSQSERHLVAGFLR